MARCSIATGPATPLRRLPRRGARYTFRWACCGSTTTEDPTRLTGYDEKPAIDFTASMGVYCFAPRALSYIEAGERLDFPDLILRLIAAGEIVRAWPSQDYWLDIGRHDDYEQAQEEFEAVRERLIPAD